MEVRPALGGRDKIILDVSQEKAAAIGYAEHWRERRYRSLAAGGANRGTVPATRAGAHGYIGGAVSARIRPRRHGDHSRSGSDCRFRIHAANGAGAFQRDRPWRLSERGAVVCIGKAPGFSRPV